MKYLVFVTFIWAFSFSFIGEFLTGIDSYFAVLVRIFLSALVFLPFMKKTKVSNTLKLKIMLIGAVQIGIMYMFFYNSFLYLSVAEVVLFTIFTPIFVTLIYDILNKKIRLLYLISALFAVLGAYIIRYHEVDSGFVKGFLLLQGANFCFALGQSYYKKIFQDYKNINQKDIFGYFHFGALIVACFAFLIFGNFTKIQPNFTQWLVLLWLGIVASGVGYFLWNKGASIVDAGILAIMNNALVPAGLLVNLIIWQKSINYINFIAGSLVILFSLYLHVKIQKRYEG